ncbi:O-antigen ligase family protein [Nostoc sp. CHAB 5834]|nr:O-antigen ligase family protein [Nostoc sp. CHAB 5834]
MYLSKAWKLAAMLWGLFIMIGAIATINSPEPVRSLLGQSTAKDGLLYWGLIAVFTLSNALLLKLKPSVAKHQLKGLIIGGVILSLSIFPQVFNWHIDYTATSGQLFKSHILKSMIYKEQQPIGLYSHRGFASFTLSSVALIAMIGCRWKWINKSVVISALSIIMPALLFTQTRAGLLALFISAGYLLGKKHYKLIVATAIASILIITIFSQTRNVNNESIISNLTSNRDYLWQISTTRIKMRPFGWGFNGFEIAYPHLPDGTIKTLPITATKAHNLFIDSALSVGIIGLVVYLGLIVFCLSCVLKSPYRDIGAVAIAYLIFTFTWYESAQYTHIFWWSLSFFDYEKISRNNSVSNELSVNSHSPGAATRQLLQVGRAAKCATGEYPRGHFRAQRTASRIRSWVSEAKARIFK